MCIGSLFGGIAGRSVPVKRQLGFLSGKRLYHGYFQAIFFLYGIYHFCSDCVIYQTAVVFRHVGGKQC